MVFGSNLKMRLKLSQDNRTVENIPNAIKLKETCPHPD